MQHIRTRLVMEQFHQVGEMRMVERDRAKSGESEWKEIVTTEKKMYKKKKN